MADQGIAIVHRHPRPAAVLRGRGPDGHPQPGPQGRRRTRRGTEPRPRRRLDHRLPGLDVPSSPAEPSDPARRIAVPAPGGHRRRSSEAFADPAQRSSFRTRSCVDPTAAPPPIVPTRITDRPRPARPGPGAGVPPGRGRPRTHAWSGMHGGAFKLGDLDMPRGRLDGAGDDGPRWRCRGQRGLPARRQRRDLPGPARRRRRRGPLGP